MTFIAQSKSPEEWKGLASSISSLVDEATFEVNPEGISFRGMDASHIALIDVFWPASGFERFECDSPLKFGVRMEDFSKLLKRADKKDSIRLSIGDDSMLTVNVEGSYKRNYKQRLIESSSSSTPLPKLTFTSKITMPSEQLVKAVGDIQVVSQYINFECKDSNMLEMSGRGDSGESRLELQRENDAIIEVKEASKANYSLDYISKIVTALTAIEKTTLEFSNKMPLRLEYSKPNGMRIHFYLAPRVQD